MLFWIPVNKAMFTGDDDYLATHDLAPVAKSAVKVFLDGYGFRRNKSQPAARAKVSEV